MMGVWDLHPRQRLWKLEPRLLATTLFLRTTPEDRITSLSVSGLEFHEEHH